MFKSTLVEFQSVKHFSIGIALYYFFSCIIYKQLLISKWAIPTKYTKMSLNTMPYKLVDFNSVQGYLMRINKHLNSFLNKGKF